VVVAGANLSIIDRPDAGQSVTSDSAGRYVFPALQQAGFTVMVSANDYLSQPHGITLTSNQTVDFALRPKPAGITLTGQLSDAATGGPIAGAVVSINGGYGSTTESSGRFRQLRGRLSLRPWDDAERSIASPGTDCRGRLEDLTVAPDDTLCFNNVQDTLGSGQDYVCRSVLVTVPSDGAVTIEAVSTQTAEHPRLEVETFGGVPLLLRATR